jgi:deazaflavin-dependent oxidoreductase (nitroreductase family)
MISVPEQAPANPDPAAVRTFPAEGSNLHRVLSDIPFRHAFHARLKRYNPLVVALYRAGVLPLLGAGRTVMLLTTKGWKSGKRRSTPIGYFTIGGVIHIFSAWGKSSSWYKNLLANPEEAWIQVGMRRHRVHARPLENPAEIQRLLECLIIESPHQARTLFGWEPGRDRLDRADFSAIIERVVVVRFEQVPA